MSERTDSGLRPVELHILLALAEEPLHGYGIIKAAEEASRGRVQLEPGTLYRALRRLEGSGLLREARRPRGASEDPRRRYYQITANGRRVLHSELERMHDLIRTAQSRQLFSDLEG